MGNNHRIPKTVTRSISFRFDTLAALDAKVDQVRGDRSSVVNDVMEHVLGIAPHPELVGRNVPFVEDRARAWEKQAKALEKEVKATKEPVGKGGLVKRPSGK